MSEIPHVVKAIVLIKDFLSDIVQKRQNSTNGVYQKCAYYCLLNTLYDENTEDNVDINLGL